MHQPTTPSPMNRLLLPVIVMLAAIFPLPSQAQLTTRQTDIAEIASRTAVGSLDSLYISLNRALDHRMTVNEVKEVLVHTYAYNGFPRALQGLKTMVRVLADRKVQGKADITGREATPVNPERNRYEHGRNVLAEISGISPDAPKADYARLSPEIEIFLKEHLFSDLFGRDVISYADREIATVAVIASLGSGVEPMLASHSKIAMNLGVTRSQIDEITALARRNLLDKQKNIPATVND